MNAFRLRAWWRYRKAAKGRHGIHSPFVYRFIEEGLHSALSAELRRQLRQDCTSLYQYKQAKTLIRCLRFLKPEVLRYAGPEAGVEHLRIINRLMPAIAFTDQEELLPHSAVLLSGAGTATSDRLFSAHAAHMPEGLSFIVTDIHSSAHNSLQWLCLRDNEAVNLSIDLWHLGLLFYRPDFKERQHFVLKFPA